MKTELIEIGRVILGALIGLLAWTIFIPTCAGL
jgi:hypothetical protein